MEHEPRETRRETGEWPSRNAPPLPIAPLRPVAKRLVKAQAVACVLACIALAGGSALLVPVLFSAEPVSLFVQSHPSAAPALAGGQLAFTSSGQLDPQSRRGLNDIVTVDLHGLSAPSMGRQDYAWLLPDHSQDEAPPLLLGLLQVVSGTASLTYHSPNHTNLLAQYSRLLVTEQPAVPLPVTPSRDAATRLALGEIPNTPTPGDEQHYSLLSHLRHLLASDPTLEQIGLSGGLDIWLYRNTGKVLEWANAVRDDWATSSVAQMRRLCDRVIEYLDGSAFAHLDLPPATPWLVDVRAGRLGLLEHSPAQEPPGYLAHVDLHLSGLIHAPGHTPLQQQQAMQIDMALMKITALMQLVRQDGMQLVQMSEAQLHQPHALSLLDDMATAANTAYAGQPDPATGGVHSGVVWLQGQMQHLATMPITVVGQSTKRNA